MGVKLNNLKGLFTDVRTRTIIIITFLVLSAAVIFGYITFHRVIKGPAASSSISGSPSITSIPGTFNPTAEYAGLVEKENVIRAQQAEKTGGSAIPTIIRAVRPGQGEVVKGAPNQPWQAGLGFQQLARLQEGQTPKGFLIDALRQSNCDKQDLEKAIHEGITVAELREAGCSAEQLRAAGFTPAQLQKGGFSACDLMGAGGVSPTAMKNAGYSAGELRGVGYNACQLKNAGFTPAELLKAGFSPEELRGVGFSPQQIASAEQQVPIAAGSNFIPGLPPGVTAAALKAAGCGVDAIRNARAEGVSAYALRAVGCTASQLKAGGFTAAELKAAGYTAGELKDAGFTAEQLKNAGFTASQLRDAGFSASQLKNAGFTASQLKAAGFSAGELKEAGFTPAQLKTAGFSANELMAAGFSPQQLKEAGFTPQEISAAEKAVGPLSLPPGVTLDSLKAAGCSANAVRSERAEGVSAAALKRIGCSATQLKAGGYSASELKAAGFTAGELKAAGFSAAQLKNAGFTAAQLRAAGFNAEELHDAGFTAAQLKNAGFTAGELRAAGFSADELKDAGFNAAQLRAAGFSPQELRDAGFSAAQLRNAGFTAGELAAAGFTPRELRTAGYSAAELKNAGFSAKQLQAAGFSPEVVSSVASSQPSSVGAAPTTSTRVIQTPQQTELQRTLTQQQKTLQAQQMQQIQQEKQGTMSGQINQLFAAWQPPSQTLVEGVPDKLPPETKNEPGMPGVPGGLASGGAGKAAPILIKAGTILFAVLTTSVNSDYPGPVLATVVSGRFKGARLIGQLTTFPPYGKQVMLTFQLLNTKQFEETIPIDAVAIDPDTARTALSSYTNNHYLLRFGSLFAASFLEGYGQAFLQSGQQVENTASSTTVTSPDLSASGKVYVALGNVGNKFGSVLNNLYSMPPTVHVYSGTGLGILFLQDVTMK